MMNVVLAAALVLVALGALDEVPDGLAGGVGQAGLGQPAAGYVVDLKEHEVPPGNQFHIDLVLIGAKHAAAVLRVDHLPVDPRLDAVIAAEEQPRWPRRR